MKMNALVVDDSRVMRNMLISALMSITSADFDFTQAEDGEDALNKFQHKHADIIFVDWNMPNMTGIDLVRRIRAMKHTENVEIIMVTSERSVGKMETALDEAGANGYVCKPFTADELEKKIAKSLERLHERKTPSQGGFFSRLMR